MKLSFVGNKEELMDYLKYEEMWENNPFVKLWKEKLQESEYNMSNCCDAPLVNGICSDCKEHAVPFDCEICKDTGVIEIFGDGEHFEYDVVGHKRCSCNED